jgi:uncharacterized membrane protein YdjX (TVP38/TMEM64 family)
MIRNRMTDPLIEWLRSFGDLSPTSGLIMTLVFVVAAFVFVPRTFLSLGVGGLYGLQAIPIILLSATLGSVLAFLIARHLFADRLQRRVDQHPQLRAIANAIDSESWRLVALLRFASPVPNSVQNYVFGLTRIRLWPYTLATFVFTIPQTLLYVYIGAVGRSILLEDLSSPLSRILMVISALCVASVFFLIWRKARTALATQPVAS